VNLWIIFITGLTTGGLTCLAVQGGLLASAMARQVTVPVTTPHHARKVRGTKSKKQAALTSIQLPKDPWPVVYFLAAKLVAYTLLGFLLGALGSALQISPTAQAIMQIVAGLFMLATALNMLNVHPIFRYAVIQPPKVLTRLVRNQSKGQEVFTPALLGFMTVLIPCGTTQTMEVLAITSGSPILGAVILFAFVLGTSPTFFVLGFLATRIRGQFQQIFAVAAAFLILFLGIVSLDGALNLLGSPITPSRIVASLFQPGGAYKSGTPVAASAVNGVQELNINAYPNGYAPSYFRVRSGQPIRLRLVTSNSYGCTRGFVIPNLRIRKILPETGETLIDLPAQPPGDLYFTCSMGMYGGVITIS